MRALAWLIMAAALLLPTGHALAAVLGTTTTAVVGTEAHAKNIARAAAAIDGAVLQPGATFSFNRTVGPMGPGSGFLPGRVFINGKVAEGYGGGVCQVSSSLYSSALKAGLTIIERHVHAIWPGYLPPGQDATVWEGLLDLKIQNPLPVPVTVRAGVTEGPALTVSLFGEVDGHEPARLGFDVLTKTPPPERVEADAALAPGERQVVKNGQEAMVVRAYRDVLRGGVWTREVLGVDRYGPVDRVIREGPAATSRAAP